MTVHPTIDAELLERAVAVSGGRTREAVVTQAIEEFVARRAQSRLFELWGQFDWEPDFDHKAERSRT